MPISRSLLAVALLAACTVEAPAVDATTIFAAIRANLKDSCKTVVFMPGSIEPEDSNDDGIQDASVDYSYVECDGSSVTFCGTAGCSVEIWAGSRSGRFTRVVELQTLGSLPALKRGGRTILRFKVHGSECGKAGAASCTLTARIDGTRFVPLGKR